MGPLQLLQAGEIGSNGCGQADAVEVDVDVHETSEPTDSTKVGWLW
jgi:hypothetical protein